MDSFLLDVVVARYEEDVRWILTHLIPMCNPRRVFVYNKGFSRCDIRHPRVTVMRLENVGREGHSYLHHIIETYATNDPRTITIFMPGSCFSMPRKWVDVETIVRSVLSSKREDNTTLPFFVCAPPTAAIHDFSIDSWTASHKSNKAHNPERALLPSPIRPYGKWCRKVLGATRSHVSACTTYFGVFAVTQDDICKRTMTTYLDIIAFVDHHPNPEAGHYLERAWPLIFGSAPYEPSPYVQLKLNASPYILPGQPAPPTEPLPIKPSPCTPQEVVYTPQEVVYKRVAAVAIAMCVICLMCAVGWCAFVRASTQST